MKKSVDWSEWILQKNNEAREEELRKSEFIEIDDLNKKVREPQISSPGWERAKYKPDAPHVEGAVKRKKYQGGDPRHEERMMQAGNFSHKTRSGQNREGGGQGEAFTSGVSTLRPKKHTDYEREEAEERVTGKKIKLNKSEDDLPDHSDWSEWILQKNKEAKQEELKKSDFVELEELEKASYRTKLPFKHGSTIHLNKATDGKTYQIHEVTDDGQTIVHDKIPYASLDRVMNDDSMARLRIGNEYKGGDTHLYDRHWSAKVHMIHWRSDSGKSGLRMELRPEGEPHTKAGEGKFVGEKN